jgi:hypothetical protein
MEDGDHVSTTVAKLTPTFAKRSLIIVHCRDKKPDRHHFTLGYDNTNPNPDPSLNWDTAHEMGYVFGLEHEHQRWDRDEHIYFNCAELVGYDRVKGEIEDYPEWDFTIEDACNGFYYGKNPRSQLGSAWRIHHQHEFGGYA